MSDSERHDDDTQGHVLHDDDAPGYVSGEAPGALKDPTAPKSQPYRDDDTQGHLLGTDDAPGMASDEQPGFSGAIRPDPN